MLSAGDFRNGKTFEMDGQVFQVVEFQHVKPGKGAAFVRTKYKNVITGAVVERSFNPTDKFEEAVIERRNMQYLYADGDLYYFMDTETYEQEPINGSKLGDAFKFVTENMECKVLSFKGNVFGVEPPTFVDLVVTETEPGKLLSYKVKVFSVEIPNVVELEVTETEPGVRGDTATNVTKPATVETGAVVRVPLFINEGEKIQIDTRTGEYLGRSKE